MGRKGQKRALELSLRGFKSCMISVRDIGWAPGADGGRLIEVYRVRKDKMTGANRGEMRVPARAGHLSCCTYSKCAPNTALTIRRSQRKKKGLS
jgi:hypothetical protein